MINGVPLSTDFRDHGIDYLNIGWTTILDIILDHADAEEWSQMDVNPEFWTAAERELATALSLIVQGTEFLLKARICEISPWLLISRNPSDWPRRCDKEDVSFSQFRTIDAQDLLKVHDTFAEHRLQNDFLVEFDSLRRQRNSIMHTVDKDIRLTAASLVEQLLMVSEHLIGEQRWVSIRKEYVERDRYSAIDVDWNDYRVAREFMTVAKVLSPASSIRFLGFNKRQRAYACPICCHNSDVELECFTATLRPNTPTSTTVYCFICGNASNVERKKCKLDTCKGNVYDPEWETCLSCLKG